MNDPRGVFLLFLLTLALLGAFAAWWLGPGLVGIVWDGEQRRSPYLVLALDSVEQVSGSPAQPFGMPELELPEGTALRWRSADPRVALGVSEPQRTRIELWTFASGGSFVRLATSGAFRDAQQQAHPQRDLYGQTAVGTAELAVTYPVLFAATRNEADPLALERALKEVLPSEAAQSWSARPARLLGRGDFEEFVLVSFPTGEQRHAWLWADATQLELELMRARFNRLQVWELGALQR